MKLTLTINLENSEYFITRAEELIAEDALLAVYEALNTPCGPSGCTGKSLEGIDWRIEN